MKNKAKFQICLVIIFNHRYDANIDKLRLIYRERFHEIIFLMPFYEGKDPNVIPVYESSYQFPGFLIQGYQKIMEMQADYYLFIGDDVILSPYVNENNVLDVLKMENKAVFITSIMPLNSKEGFSWEHAKFSSDPFMKTHQTQWSGNIPEYREALDKFEDFFGIKYPEIYGEEFFGSNIGENKEEKNWFIQKNGNSLNIPYPMAWGYSDIFIIKRESLFSISRLCGVFSAMNMFAEISLQTAIVLSIPRKDVVFLKNTKMKYTIDWDGGNRFKEKYHCNFSLLYQDWKKDNLFIHPIKLSQWMVKGQDCQPKYDCSLMCAKELMEQEEDIIIS